MWDALSIKVWRVTNDFILRADEAVCAALDFHSFIVARIVDVRSTADKAASNPPRLLDLLAHSPQCCRIRVDCASAPC
eukprot:3936884-Rhodomonas_salina.1